MLTKVIDQSKIDHFAKWLERADKIVIVAHVAPDGDAVGSSLGLWHFLNTQDKDATVIVPNAFPDFLKWECPESQARGPFPQRVCKSSGGRLLHHSGT
jgi:phosphoesterase RecJ-like protein